MKTKIIILLTFFLISCGKNKKTENIKEIKIPENIEKIVSISPTTSDILADLGMGKKIIALDDYSIKTPHIADKLKDEVVVTKLLYPDMEEIVAMKPDIVFVSTMSKVDGLDPFRLLKNVGIPVIYVTISESVDEIKENIMLVGKITKTEEKAKLLIDNMEKELSSIAAIGKTITNKKRVYFEIQAPPAIYTFGEGVFLNEIIQIIGAENIFKKEHSWIAVSSESIVLLNPDVIITSVEEKYNTREAIQKRNGWDKINAIKNDEIYYMNPQYISVPTHNVVHAIKDMAKKLYKEEYGKL